MDMVQILELISRYIKGSIAGVIGLVILFFIVYSIVMNIYVEIIRGITQKNPSAENAWRMYKTLKPFFVTITNHPSSWSKYRNMFNAVNHSEQVQSEVKESLKKVLMKKGLFIDNVRIINNYKTENK